jgi:lysozyme
VFAECANGAQVEDKYCTLFVYYERDPKKELDSRIADALGITKSSETRAIGLVVAISKYPKIEGADLEAAGVDGRRLVSFLVESQKFDEVIYLSDSDATPANLKYFLSKYLPGRASYFKGKARLLIAYSGHGQAPSKTNVASFVMSNAESFDDPEGVFEMSGLALYLDKLSESYFHVLTLINACFGGNFYLLNSKPGNADSISDPGSYAITAGDEGNEVYALNPARGSVFFDNLINAVTRGDADIDLSQNYQRQSGDGEVIRTGYTRTMMLASYLTRVFGHVNVDIKSAGKNLKLSMPWFGPAQTEYARGGFFFLTDRNGYADFNATRDTKTNSLPSWSRPRPASGRDLGWLSTSISTGQIGQVFSQNNPAKPPLIASAGSALPGATPVAFGLPHAPGGPIQTQSQTQIPPIPGEIKTVAEREFEFPVGPVSSVAGRPDIKIFKPPSVYPISGYDISSADGNIDWDKFLGDKKGPRFVYVRAMGWKSEDKAYAANVVRLKKADVDFGFYVKYNFCKSPEDQLETLKKLVDVDYPMLPPAILLVNPYKEDDLQLACFNSVGIEQVRNNILLFASSLLTAYGKTPVMYGNHNNLSTFLDDRFNAYMIWVGYWGTASVKYGGANPWTLWQYSGTLDSPGIGPRTTGEVFFGTEDQYQLFKAGKGNVALDAVDPLHLGPPAKAGQGLPAVSLQESSAP